MPHLFVGQTVAFPQGFKKTVISTRFRREIPVFRVAKTRMTWYSIAVTEALRIPGFLRCPAGMKPGEVLDADCRHPVHFD